MEGGYQIVSKTIDERVVSMQFDNAQFERNVQTSLSTIEKLKRSLNFSGASKGLENINAAAKNVDMSGMSSAIESIKVKFSALEVMAVTALANITNSAINAGKRMVKALTLDPIISGFQEYETQINAVQTILANTSSKGTTIDQVNAALDELNTYADKTIYNFTEMTRNIGTFTAAGVDLDKAVTSIKGIANLAAASGSSSMQASTAMYQLSQAIAAGKVQLMDWNSVVNAGMGGELFQNALKRTARHFGYNVDAMIEKYGSFRESLTQGNWLTTEVLTETLTQLSGAYTEADLIAQGYTEKQAKEIVEMAKTAEDAATKVKTFTQLVDTTKEALQSGWTQSWEIIIGDFEEAKELFTEVSDVLGDMVSKSADARNAMLEGGLASGWDQFLGKGISNEGDFVDTVKIVAKEHNIAIDEMVDKAGSFDKTLKDGWLTSEMLSESVSKYADKLENMSEEELKAAGYTKEHVRQIQELEQGIKDGTVSLDEFTKKMVMPSGRENLIEALKNSFKGLADTIKPIHEAFREIFPRTTAEQLYNLTETLKNLSERFKISEETADKLKRTFKGVFSVFSFGVEVVKALLKGFVDFVGFLLPAGNGILDITASIGDFVSGINEALKSSDAFNNTIENIKKVLSPLAGFLTNLFNIITGGISSITDSASGGILDGLSFGIETFAEISSKAAMLIGNAFEKISNALTSVFKEGSLEPIFDIVNAGLFSGILIGIKKFIDKLGEISITGGGFLDSLKGILDGVKGSLEAWQSSIKANTLMKIAGAIAILSASLVVLSAIDATKLATSLSAMTVMFAQLFGSMAIFGHLMEGKAGFIGMAKLSASMIALSTAVLILSSAVKKLSSFNWGELATGLVGVGVLCAELALFMKVADFDGVGPIRAAGLVILASAINILANAVSKFKDLSAGEITKGLAAVGGILAELAIFTKLTSNSKSILSVSIGMTVIASSMLIFSKAMSSFKDLKWKEIGKGLSVIAGSLLSVGIALNIIPSGSIKKAAAVAGIAASMLILGDVIKQISGFGWEDIGKSAVVISGAMVIFVAALKLMSTGLPGAAALLTISAALVIFTPIIKALGNMEWGSIARGLTILAGSFTIIGVAGKLLTPVIPTLLALSGVITLLGIGTLAAGAGVAAFAAGLSALAVSGVAGGAALVAIIKNLIGLIPDLFKEIGEGIIEFSKVIGEGASTLSEAFVAMIEAGCNALISTSALIAEALLKLVYDALSALAEYAPEITDKLFDFIIGLLETLSERVPELIVVGAELLGNVLKGIFDAMGKFKAESLFNTIGAIAALVAIFGVLSAAANIVKRAMVTTALMGIVMAGITVIFLSLGSLPMEKTTAIAGSLSALLLSLSGSMKVLSLVPIAGAVKGVASLGAFVAGLTVIIAALGGIAQIPGFKWLMEEGTKVLGQIGTAIGSFVGNIVAGFMNGVSSSFPQIGEDLSGFMENAKPFFDGIKNVDANSMNGIKALAEAILILTGAGVLDGLTSWLTGGNSMVKFGKDLSEFGPYFSKYYESIRGVDGSVVEASANAAKALAEFATNIPNEGGLVSVFTGNNNLSDFADQLVIFGPKFKQYADSVSGINPEVVTSSANAAKVLAEFANNLPNSGGLVSWITGDITLSEFGAEIAKFGPYLKTYADSMIGIKPELITNSANAAKGLAELANALPNSGGLVSWFAGNNDIDSFGAGLAKFGEDLSKYSSSVEGVNPDAVVSATNAAQSLVDLSKSLPEKGLFDGQQSFGSFGLDIASFGVGLSKYYQSISGIDNGILSSVIAEISKLLDIAKGMMSIDTDTMRNFGEAMEKLGDMGVDGLVDAFNGAYDKVNDSIQSTFKTLIDNISSRGSELKSAMDKTISAALIGISSKYNNFRSEGSTLVSKMIDGIKSKSESVPKAFVSVLERAINEIRSLYKQFYNSAAYLVSGFVAGIDNNVYKAASAAARMAQAASNAANRELDINSPSKVGYRSGSFYGLGFVNAITDYAKNAYSAGANMAASARNGLDKTISMMQSIFNSDVDVTPSIRPVLDLSDVNDGVGRLNTMFAMQPSIGVMSNLNAISSIMDQRNQNDRDRHITDAIKDLKKAMGQTIGDTYNINGITYDSGSEVSQAIQTLVRAAKIERRK
jgi:tape measure domain-containing protein